MEPQQLKRRNGAAVAMARHMMQPGRTKVTRQKSGVRGAETVGRRTADPLTAELNGEPVCLSESRRMWDFLKGSDVRPMRQGMRDTIRCWVEETQGVLRSGDRSRNQSCALITDRGDRARRGFSDYA